MLLDTKVCDVCLQNNAGYTGKLQFLSIPSSLTSYSLILAVMMAAVIDISNGEQRKVVSRLFRESGNINVKTTAVMYLI